jgi:hypothetical protein
MILFAKIAVQCNPRQCESESDARQADCRFFDKT